jgi:ABC-type bacteriocin/lantibiotic exporter with double-glycine peptidase domain
MRLFKFMYTHNMQNSMNDCGIAAILTVLDQLKINRANFGEIYNKSKKLTVQGLSIDHIIDIFDKYGVSSAGFIVDDFKELKKQKFPIIAVIIQDGVPHYIVLHEIEGEEIIISNPSESHVQRILISDFEEIFSNKVICIEKFEKNKKESEYTEKLYNKIVKSINFKDKSQIVLLTLCKLSIPLIGILGIEYVLSNKLGILTTNKVLALLLCYIPILLLFNYANTATASIRVKLTNKLQKEVMDKYYLSEIEDVSFNKNVSQITGYFWNLLTAISGLIQFFYLKIDLLYGGLLLLILALVSPYCIPILIFWGLLYGWFAKKNMNDINNLYSSTLTNSNVIASIFEENINSACDISVFNKKEASFLFYQKKMNTFFDSNVSLVEKETKMNTLLEVFNILILLSYFVVFFLFFKMGSLNRLESFGNGLLLLYLIATNFKPIYSNWVSFQKSKNAISYIENEQQTFKVSPIKQNLSIDIAEKIEIKNLSFNYGQNEILRNVNIYFEKGKVHGIKGDNGSGKSTLISIILGFLKEKSIDIQVNDRKINSFFETNIVDHISYYSTEMNVYQNTVKNNINFSVFDEKVSENEHTDSLPLNLPDDFVVIGGGNNISVGQRQKILLMRTLRQDKDIYIFDEPTGNLDSESTRKFIEEISLLTQKIVIVITHQKALLDKCDVIYELREGVIYEG